MAGNSIQLRCIPRSLFCVSLFFMLALFSKVGAAVQYLVPPTCFASGQFPAVAPGSAFSFEYRETLSKRAYISVWQQRCDPPTSQSVLLMRVSPLEGVTNVSALSFRFDQASEFPDSTGFYPSPGAQLGAAAVSVEHSGVYLVGARPHRDAQNQFIYQFVPERAFTLTVSLPAGGRASNGFPALMPVDHVPPSTAENRVLGLWIGEFGAEHTELIFTNSGTSTAEVRGSFLDPAGRAAGLPDGVLIPVLRTGQSVRMSLGTALQKLEASPWAGYGSFRLALPVNGISVQVLRTGGLGGAIGNLSCASNIAAPVVPGKSNADKAEVVVYNLSEVSAELAVTVFHQDGSVLGQRSAPLEAVPAGGSRVYEAAKLGSAVGVGDWTQRARVEFTSPQGKLRVLNLLRPDGHALTNVSCPSREGLYNITGSTNLDQTYLRFINTANATGQVVVTLYSQDGVQISPRETLLVKGLPGKSSLVLSSVELQNQLSIAPWEKRAWLDLSGSSPGIEALALIRTPANVLMDNTCARNSEAFFISPVGAADSTFLRITNTTESAKPLNAELWAADGERVGGRVVSLGVPLAAKSTAVLSSVHLQQIFGGTWTPPGVLRVHGYSGLKILSMNRSGNDVLSNLSCAVSVQGAGFTSWLGNELIYNGGTIKAGSRVGIHVFNGTSTSFQVESFIVLNGGLPLAVEDVMGTVLSGGGSFARYYSFSADTPHSGLDLVLRLRSKDSGMVHDVSVSLPRP